MDSQRKVKGKKSVVKRTGLGMSQSDEVNQMEDDKSTKRTVNLLVPKIGCSGAKNAVNEMNENILRAEAMYAANDILNTIINASAIPNSFDQNLWMAQSHPQTYYQSYPQEPYPPEPSIYDRDSMDSYSPSYTIPTQVSRPSQGPRGSVKVGRRTDLEGTIDDVLLKMQVVEGKIEILGNTCSLILEDGAAKEHQMRALVEKMDELERKKADKGVMHKLLETKASHSEIFDKLSHTDFLVAMEELSDGLMKSVHLICKQELLFQDAVDVIIWELGRKLNRFELKPIRDIVNINLKKLYDRVRRIEKMKNFVQAAATRKQLSTKQICLSCDMDAVMKDCDIIPMAPPFIPHTNIKPFLSYQLDRIKKNPPRNRICNRYCGGSHTVMHRQGRLGRWTSKDYPCFHDFKPGKRSPKKTKKSSVDPEYLKAMLWDATLEHMDTQRESYVKGSKIRDPYRGMELATKLVIVSPDLDSVDSEDIPTYEDTRWKLTNIDPSNPALIDHLPIKVGKHGVYYPLQNSPYLETHPPTPDTSFSSEPRGSEVRESLQGVYDGHYGKGLHKSIAKGSKAAFKARKEYTDHLKKLVAKRSVTYRTSLTLDKDSLPEHTGSTDETQRKSEEHREQKDSKTSTTSYEVFRDGAPSIRLQSMATSDYSRDDRKHSLMRDYQSKTEKVNKTLHHGQKARLAGSGAIW